jgi:serine/threonine-protein kinase
MVAIRPLGESETLWAGYRLRQLRGVGAFGRVWEAEAPDGTAVALKTVECKPGIAMHEIRSFLKIFPLSHPHIVRIDKVWCERRRLVFVMELANGSLLDLADVSQAEFGRPLSANTLSDYFRQAAKALDFLNARNHVIGGVRVGIQHRDIKPSNLLVFGDTIKLCDFGLATMTASSTVLHASAGTTPYAAPEVFRGGLSDWTDQYALAVTYCHLRGRLPFSDTPSEFRPDYVRPAPDLSMLDPAEQPIIARALSSAPQDRWPCCEDMCRQLAAFVKKRADVAPERRL